MKWNLSSGTRNKRPRKTRSKDRVHLGMLSFYLSQVQMTLKTGVGHSVWDGKAKRTERPEDGLKKKARADWHTMT